jgi:hypothetical protein
VLTSVDVFAENGGGAGVKLRKRLAWPSPPLTASQTHPQ